MFSKELTMNQDIERAEKHLNDMAKSTLLNEYEMSWQDFLYRLEMIWEITKKRYERESWFPKVYGPYSRFRKKDPLLRYLKQARNAETHTIEGTLESSLNIMFNEKYGRPFQISQIKSSFENGKLTIDIDSPDLLYEYEAEVYRGTPELIRFKCRKDWYNPPSQHLGNNVNTRCPVVIGKLGLEYCKAFISEIELYAKT